MSDNTRNDGGAAAVQPIEALREMANDGFVLVSAWVVQDEVKSYRVTARGRDGWRKSADARTLDAAILAAHDADYQAASSNATEESA